MHILKRLKEFDRQHGRWILPGLLAALILFDWVFPMRGAIEQIENHRPNQIRFCFGFTGSWNHEESEHQRFFLLVPSSFRSLTAVGVHRSSIDGINCYESRFLFVFWVAIVLFAAGRFAFRRDRLPTAATEREMPPT